jgi:predicted dehydrogenase
VSKLNVGIIGAGHIAAMHYEGYNKEASPGRLYAIADVDPKRLEQRKTEWKVEKAYLDYRDLLNDPKVDAVEVIVPHNLHAKIGVETLKAGKPLSLQKPMAMNIAECDAIIDASKRSGTMLRVFENFRYYPPLVKAMELLQAGEIGDPLSMRMKVTLGSLKGWDVEDEMMIWRYDPARCGGGRVIFDYGYHLFSVAMWLMGDVEKVHAWITYRPTKYGIIDSPVVVTWKYKNAEKYGTYEAITSGDLLVRSKYFPEDEWFEITGRRGFIWVNRCSSMLLDRPPVVMYRDGVTTEFSNLDTDWGSSFVLGVHDFVNAVKEGRQADLTGEEGKRVHQFCRAIQRSAKESREVKLDEITSD